MYTTPLAPQASCVRTGFLIGGHSLRDRAGCSGPSAGASRDKESAWCQHGPRRFVPEYWVCTHDRAASAGRFRRSSWFEPAWRRATSAVAIRPSIGRTAHSGSPVGQREPARGLSGGGAKGNARLLLYGHLECVFDDSGKGGKKCPTLSQTVPTRVGLMHHQGGVPCGGKSPASRCHGRPPSPRRGPETKRDGPGRPRRSWPRCRPRRPRKGAGPARKF